MEVNHNIGQKRGIKILIIVGFSFHDGKEESQYSTKKEELQAAYNQLANLLMCSCCNPEAVSNLIPHVGVVEVEDD